MDHSEEVCDDCGEDHNPLNLEDTLKKIRVRSRLFIVAYFTSLVLLGYVAFRLVGVFGAVGVLAGFGVYISHLNMRVTLSHVEAIEGALGEHSSLSTTKKDKGRITGHGQYL